MLSSLLLAVLPLQLVLAEDLVVQTSLGPVSGSLRNTTKGRPYYSFQGLPYAAPPVGSLRLLPPQPPNTWTSVLDLSGDTEVMCPQLSETVTGDLLGQEDCLYLNIYAPVMESDSLLPVMVFIYGGGFITGSDRAEEYGPSRWLEEEVLVVTLNYRLYSLGFMSLGTSHAPGNQVSHSLRTTPVHRNPFEGTAGPEPRPPPGEGQRERVRRRPGPSDADGSECGLQQRPLPPDVSPLRGTLPADHRSVWVKLQPQPPLHHCQ